VKPVKKSTVKRCKALGVELALPYPDQAKILEGLILGLEDALGFQRQLDGFTVPTQGVRELADLLKKVSTALGKIANHPHLLKAKRARINGRIRTFKTTLLEKLTLDTQKITIENRQLLDSLYYEANNKDSTLLFCPDLSLDECGFDRAIKNLADTSDNKIVKRKSECLKKAVDYFKSTLKRPGSGGTKSAGRFIPGIEMLARYFKQFLPGKKISAKPGTFFFNYVRFWFNEIGEGPQESPERHIQAFLDSPLYDLLMDSQPHIE
jgi:hypothetical protein